jgi:hypothetical protein
MTIIVSNVINGRQWIMAATRKVQNIKITKTNSAEYNKNI